MKDEPPGLLLRLLLWPGRALRALAAWKRRVVPAAPPDA